MIKNKEEFNQALNLVYFFLKFRPRTKKEIIAYLQKKSRRYHFDETTIDAVVKELEDNRLINDEKFIEWFIEERSRIKQKSSFVLKSELLRLGVEKTLIDAYFNLHPQNEEELAVKALFSRWYRFQDLPQDEKFRKAVQFLMRRGFDFDIAKKAIDEVEKK